MLLLIQAALSLPAGCIAAFKYAQWRRRSLNRNSEGSDAPLTITAQAHQNLIDCLDPVSVQIMQVSIDHRELPRGPREGTEALTSLEMHSNDPVEATIAALAPEFPLDTTNDHKKAGGSTGGCKKGNCQINFQDMHEVARCKVMLSELRENVTKLEAQLLACKAGQTNEILHRDDASSMVKQLTQQDEVIGSLTVQISSLETQLRALRQENSTASLEKDLAFAHVRIQALKDEIMAGTSHTKAQLLLLKEHFGKLQHDVNHVEHHLRNNTGIEQSVHSATRELEVERSELRGSNQTLSSEIQELTQKVASAQGRAAEIAPATQSDAMAAEYLASELRSINNSLARKIEELQLSRFIEIEELVYLRWVNACLHHELDLYKGSSGTSVSVASDDECNSSNHTEEHHHEQSSATSYVSSPSAVEVASKSPHSHDKYYRLNRPLSLEIQHTSRTSNDEDSGKRTYHDTKLSGDFILETKHMKRSPSGQPRLVKQFVQSVSNVSPGVEGLSTRSNSKSNTLAVHKQRRHSSSLLDEYLQHRHLNCSGSDNSYEKMKNSKKASLRFSSSLPSHERWSEIEGSPPEDVRSYRRTLLHDKARSSGNKSNVGHGASSSSSSSSKQSDVAVSFQLLSLGSQASNEHRPVFKDLATHNQHDIDGVSKMVKSPKDKSANAHITSTSFEPIENVFAIKSDFPETSAFTACWQEKYVPQTIVQH